MSYSWYQSHGTRFSKSNRLLNHMCSRSMILVIFVQDVKLGENEKKKKKKNTRSGPEYSDLAETEHTKVLGFKFYTKIIKFSSSNITFEVIFVKYAKETVVVFLKVCGGC
ncbi:hypothetical protein Hanom_Chr09g00802381 [Helianthus anomalus]